MFKQVHAVLVLALAATLVSAPVFSEDSAKSPEEIKAKLKEVRPDLEFSDPVPSTIDGFYEVKAGSQYLYIAEDGDRLIAGDVFLIKDGEFIKEKDIVKRKQRKEIVANLDRDQEIVFSPSGPVKGSIHVFTDVDCGYCQKLHQDVPELNARGIEVRYLAYPRMGLESESFQKIASAWCAKDQQTAMTKLKNREEIPIKVCKKNPVAAHFALGNEIELTGTPTLLFPDGEMVGGYISVDRIAKILEIE